MIGLQHQFLQNTQETKIQRSNQDYYMFNMNIKSENSIIIQIEYKEEEEEEEEEEEG